MMTRSFFEVWKVKVLNVNIAKNKVMVLGGFEGLEYEVLANWRKF